MLAEEDQTPVATSWSTFRQLVTTVAQHTREGIEIGDEIQTRWNELFPYHLKDCGVCKGCSKWYETCGQSYTAANLGPLPYSKVHLKLAMSNIQDPQRWKSQCPNGCQPSFDHIKGSTFYNHLIGQNCRRFTCDVCAVSWYERKGGTKQYTAKDMKTQFL